MHVYHLVDDEGLFSDDRNKEKYLKQLIDEWISCDLKFGFSNQEKDKEIECFYQRPRK